MEDDSLEIFYVEDDVDIESLKTQVQSDEDDNGGYRSQTQEAYDRRHALWPGKNMSLRKEGSNSLPWEGASDQEVRLVENVIKKYVGLFMTGLQQGNVRVFPTEASDTEKSQRLAMFVRWLRDQGVQGFTEKMELAANYLLEKGIAVAYCGFSQTHRLSKQKVDLEELSEVAPELVEMLSDETRDEEFIQLLSESFEGVNEKRAKKALKQLRRDGVADFPVVIADLGRPTLDIESCDYGAILPSYITDIQSSPRISLSVLMTVQQIENAVVTEGWDKDWADDVIENHRGIDYAQRRGVNEFGRSSQYSRQSAQYGSTYEDTNDLVEVMFTWRRLFDKEDGASGIYLDIYHMEAEGYAKHELQEGMTEYPFVAVRIGSNRNFFDVTTFADMLRGPQSQAKNIRDGWTDQQSLAISPPFMHPVGRAPSSFGAGAWIGVRPNDRFEFMQVPSNVRTDTQIEEFVMKEAFDLVGLDIERPLSNEVQQFYLEKFLRFARDVLRMLYKQYVLNGDPNLQFRVTGADPVQLSPDDFSDDIDVSITFDLLSRDPENMKSKLDAFVNLMQMDSNGRFDQNAMLELAANMIDPSSADMILRPAEEARADILRKIADDLSLIWSGQSVGAQPTGAQVALQYIQEEYIVKPNVAQRLAEDVTFAEDLSTYVQQYEMQLMQQQNAVTGRIGTAPATLQGVNTQGA